jgi:integrase
LTRAAANAFRDRLLKSRSERLTRCTLSTVSLAIEQARDCGLASVNNVKSVKVRSSSRGLDRVDIPPKPDVSELLNRSSGVIRPMLAIACFCGLRISEILGLRWGDLDFECGQVRVRQRVDRWGVIGHPKSAAGVREIPMGSFVSNTLKEWRVRSSGDDLVFCKDDGAPLCYYSVYHQLYRPLFKATDGRREVSYINLHRLRHFAVSTWIETGFAPKKVMTFAGHSSITLTFDRYGHLFPSQDDDRAAFDKIESGILRL